MLPDTKIKRITDSLILLFGVVLFMYGLVHWKRMGFSFSGIFHFNNFSNPLHLTFIGLIAAAYAALELFRKKHD